jgi:hypothetical protein
MKNVIKEFIDNRNKAILAYSTASERFSIVSGRFMNAGTIPADQMVEALKVPTSDLETAETELSKYRGFEGVRTFAKMVIPRKKVVSV